MKFTKRNATVSALTAGGILFVTAAGISFASSNGYELYKNALENLTIAKDYSVEMKAEYEFDGEIEGTGEMVEKVSESDGFSRTEMSDGKLSSATYYQDGLSIYGYNYYVPDGNENGFRYTVYDDGYHERPQTMLEDITGTRGDGKTAEKFKKFAEIAIDLIVGDLKNNFIYEGTDDGVSSYSLELDSFQIPELISTGIDYIITLNNSSFSVEELKERADKAEPFDYLYENVVIENVKCDVQIEDENLKSNNIEITVTGDDWDGIKHTIIFRFDIKCYDFGTTVPDRLDLENTPNVYLRSDEIKARTDELNALIASEDISEDDREKYQYELDYLTKQPEALAVAEEDEEVIK